MRKNKMMRLASMLLVLCLLTTSVISGTFAKYITTDQYEDTARVAKFGVVATVSGDLFGATYSKAEGNSIVTYDFDGGTVSSAVGKDDYVVAPGTKNDTGLKIAVAGTPEVATNIIVDKAEDKDGKDYANSDIYLAQGDYAVMVKYEGVVTNGNVNNYYAANGGGSVFNPATTASVGKELYELHDITTVADKDYYPLNWYVDDVKVDNQAAVVAAIEALALEEIAPNTELDRGLTVTWDWNFNKSWADVDDNQEQTSQEDKMDTILGNMMAAQKGDSIIVVKKDGNNYKPVKYKVEPAVNGVNEVINVYDAKGQKVACLTVAFNARLTVEQVD